MLAWLKEKTPTLFNVHPREEKKNAGAMSSEGSKNRLKKTEMLAMTRLPLALE